MLIVDPDGEYVRLTEALGGEVTQDLSSAPTLEEEGGTQHAETCVEPHQAQDDSARIKRSPGWCRASSGAAATAKLAGHRPAAGRGPVILMEPLGRSLPTVSHHLKVRKS